MSATIEPFLAPDPATMREFLEHCFGGYLDGYHDGLIELAFKDAQENWHARLYGTDELDLLVEVAVGINSQPGTNVYVGAWLRRPGTATERRSNDADAWAMTCAYVDLDDEGAASAAKEIYGALKPSWITVTGVHPHTRAQMWWRLAEPITDHNRGRDLLKLMAAAMHGDPTIVNPSRIMRLPGSVAWPTKDGRRVEATRRGTLKEGGAKVYAAESLERVFTERQVIPPIGDSPRATTESSKPDLAPRAAASLGLPLVLADGREQYMRDTTLAMLIEYMGTNGAVPSAHELCEYAWPQYSQNVDFSRPGRGKDELYQKCISTLRRFEAGSLSGLRTIEDAIAVYRAKTVAKAPQPLPVSDSIIVPYQRRDRRAIKPREWIYGRHYIRKFISSTVAPGGVGKSSLTIAEALAICSGKAILGTIVDERANVMLWNGEDPMEELERRIEATIDYHGLTDTDVAGRLFVSSGHDKPITMAKKTKDGVIINAPLKDALIEALAANNIGVFIVDPFVSSHQVSENDNSEIEQVAALWGEVAVAADCSIELVHHVRKTIPGQAVQVEDGRGAGALLAKARCARAINRMTPEEGSKAGVENHRFYFRTDDGKANLAPPSENAKWFHMVSFDLENGTGLRDSDKVGVVTRWEWPDMFEGVTGNDVEALLAAMGAKEFRADARSKEGWVGNLIMEVLGLDAKLPGSVAKAKFLQKVWTENGTLSSFEKTDHKGVARGWVRRGK